MSLNIIPSELLSVIVKDISIKNYMMLMVSSKYLFELRKIFIKNVKNYNDFDVKHSDFLKTLFSSNISSYPVITSNLRNRNVSINTVNIMLFDYRAEKIKYKKDKIQSDLFNYLKENVKINYKYNKSHKISINSHIIFTRFCSVKNWDNIDINIYTIFESIYHLLYKNYDGVVEIVDNMITDEKNTDICVITNTIKVFITFISEYKNHYKYAHITKILMIYIMYSYITKNIYKLYKNKNYKFMIVISQKARDLCYEITNNRELPDGFKEYIIDKLKHISFMIDNDNYI